MRTSFSGLTGYGQYPVTIYEHPYSVQIEGQEYGVQYLPAESNTGMFGGNSNWRGPVWMPVNQLIVRGFT